MPSRPSLTRCTAISISGRSSGRPPASCSIDFEGEPMRPIEERRRLAPAMRDVASLLLSFDHVST